MLAQAVALHPKHTALLARRPASRSRRVSTLSLGLATFFGSCGLPHANSVPVAQVISDAVV